MVIKTEVERFNSLLAEFESSKEAYFGSIRKLDEYKSFGYKYREKERMRNYKSYARCMKEKIKDRYPVFNVWVRDYGFELVFQLTLEFASIHELPLAMIVSPVNIFAMSKDERLEKGRECLVTEAELEKEYKLWLNEYPEHEEWFADELEDCKRKMERHNEINKFKQLDAMFEIDETSAVLYHDVSFESGFTMRSITDWVKSLCLPDVKVKKITRGKKGEVVLIKGIKFQNGLGYKLYDFELSKPSAY